MYEDDKMIAINDVAPAAPVHVLLMPKDHTANITTADPELVAYMLGKVKMIAEKTGIAGEILLTSMDCDGTKAGYDIELTRTIAGNVSIPVIASGGAGNMEHFYDAFTEGKADAALAASLFHYKEMEIRDLKKYLAGKGISVRL